MYQHTFIAYPTGGVLLSYSSWLCNIIATLSPYIRIADEYHDGIDTDTQSQLCIALVEYVDHTLAGSLYIIATLSPYVHRRWVLGIMIAS